MGYDTSSYTMYGIKIPEDFEEFKQLYFTEALELLNELEPEELSDNDQEFIKKAHEFWTDLEDWYDFEQATNLAIQYAGDARFDIEFVFLGEHMWSMNDDQTKNDFADSVKKKILAVPGLDGQFGMNRIDDSENFEWSSFSWTC